MDRTNGKLGKLTAGTQNFPQEHCSSHNWCLSATSLLLFLFNISLYTKDYMLSGIYCNNLKGGCKQILLLMTKSVEEENRV